MELHEAIRTIVDQFGKDIITERRFLYMLADYYSFRDNPAEKHVISAMVNDGCAQIILNISSQENIAIIEGQILNKVCGNYGFREDIVQNVIKAIEEGIGLSQNCVQEKPLSNNEYNKSSETVSVPLTTPLTPYEYLLTEDYIVSLYTPLFSRYAHTDAEKIQEKLNIKGEEVYTLIHFLEKIKVLKYNCYAQNYDVCVSSPHALRKHYKEWKNGEIANKKPHLFSLQEMEDGLEHLLKQNFTNIQLLAKYLKTDEDRADIIFQELKRIKIINDMGALINPYLDVKTIAKKVWRKC